MFMHICYTGSYMLLLFFFFLYVYAFVYTIYNTCAFLYHQDCACTYAYMLMEGRIREKNGKTAQKST